MGSKHDLESIEAQIGRAFEQVIPFNRVLGLKIDSLDPKAPRLRFGGPSWSATRSARSCTAA